MGLIIRLKFIWSRSACNSWLEYISWAYRKQIKTRLIVAK